MKLERKLKVKKVYCEDGLYIKQIEICIVCKWANGAVVNVLEHAICGNLDSNQKNEFSRTTIQSESSQKDNVIAIRHVAGHVIFFSIVISGDNGTI